MEIYQLKYNSQRDRFMVGEYELHAQDWLNVLIPDHDTVQKLWWKYSSECDYLLGCGNVRTDWKTLHQVQNMLFDCLFHAPWHQSMILYNHGATGKDCWYLESYPDIQLEGLFVCL